jgi:hypothetical protein
LLTFAEPCRLKRCNNFPKMLFSHRPVTGWRAYPLGVEFESQNVLGPDLPVTPMSYSICTERYTSREAVSRIHRNQVGHDVTVRMFSRGNFGHAGLLAWIGCGRWPRGIFLVCKGLVSCTTVFVSTFVLE